MDAVIKQYAKEIVSAIEYGYEGEPKVNESSGAYVTAPSGNVSWSFTGAFLYSLTVITTIGITFTLSVSNDNPQSIHFTHMNYLGYGNVVPKKPWGKIATILYGIIGMPLFLLYLSNIGDILARGFKWTFARCCQCRYDLSPFMFLPSNLSHVVYPPLS